MPDITDPYSGLPELSSHAYSLDGPNTPAPPPYSAQDAHVTSLPAHLNTSVTLTTSSLPSNQNTNHGDPPEVKITGFREAQISDRQLVPAYILAAGLGFLGAHHFYLKRPRFGVLYMFTLGLLGIGWLTDLCRLPSLLKKANSRLKDSATYFSGPEDRDCFYAYIMWLPLGLLGVHQYYLRRWKWAVLYTFTLGIFGIGWLIDVARIPSMIRDCNKQLADERNNVREHGPHLKSVTSAYLLAIPPVGIFGGHHYYMGRRGFGCLYTLTCGLALFGWLADLVRMSCLVKRVNQKIQQDFATASDGHVVTDDNTKHLGDAYILHCSPFGILGASHFYLGRYTWGIAYLLTGGFLFIGWIIDMFRLPKFIRTINSAEEARRNQVRIEFASNTQIILVTDGRIVAEAETGARTPTVVPAIIGQNVPSVSGDQPPTYDSIVAKTTDTDGASGGAEASMPNEKDTYEQDVTSAKEKEAGPLPDKH